MFKIVRLTISTGGGLELLQMILELVVSVRVGPDIRVSCLYRSRARPSP